MKVLITLACVIAATSALPYILLDDGEPSYRVRRQLEPQGFKRPVLKRQDQFVDQYEDDLDSAADTPYGAAVSFIRNHRVRQQRKSCDVLQILFVADTYVFGLVE